jgi:hypothetical protein
LISIIHAAISARGNPIAGSTTAGCAIHPGSPNTCDRTSTTWVRTHATTT